MVAAPQKRRFVVLAKEKGLSERSACRLIRLSRTVARYRVQPKQDDNDLLVEHEHSSAVSVLKEIARKKRRRGYRLAHRQLRLEGWSVGVLECQPQARTPPVEISGFVRSSEEESQASSANSDVKGRGSKPSELCLVTRACPWCIDFAQDRTIHGTKLQILCVTDEFTRESLALEVNRSFTSEQVCQVLERLLVTRGKPSAVRTDNGRVQARFRRNLLLWL